MFYSFLANILSRHNRLQQFDHSNNARWIVPLKVPKATPATQSAPADVADISLRPTDSTGTRRTSGLAFSGKYRCTNSEQEQDEDGTAVPSSSCSQAVSRPVWRIPLLRVRCKTTDDGQRNCPKHVDFYSKNKFEKSVHLAGFDVEYIYGFVMLGGL